MNDLPLEVTVDEAKELRQVAQILDVREPHELEAAHLVGTIDIPMNEVPRRVSELDKVKRLIVMCHHGGRSLMVARWLRANGFPQAQSMAGGIDVWSQTVDPTIPRY